MTPLPALAMLLLVLPADPGWGAASQVALRPEVTVDTPVLLLGQVAALSGPASERLSAVSLGSAPVPGGVRMLSAEYLRLRLRRHGLDPATVAWVGEQVLVRRPGLQAMTVPAAGAPLSSAPAGQAAPVIRRHDPVSLRVRCGQVTITLHGRACGEGQIGRTVGILTVPGARPLEATVMGPGETVLDL